MSEDIAKLGIAIDATQVTPAASKLDDLAASGAKAEQSTNNVTASAKQLATALAATGGDLTKATALLLANADAAKASATALAQNATVATASATATAQAAAVAGSAWAEMGAAANASLGLTETAIKSAQASYAVFASSLAGQSAIAAASVEAEAAVIVEAAGTMAESLGALGSAAVQSAAAIGASAEAAAAAEVESAAVTVAAHGAVRGSSRAVTESLVLVREAARGNFTRMAGSASILLQALGLLNAILIPLAVTAAAVGGAIELATNQINSGAQGTGDLTRNLDLTATQLEKVKDRYVSFGDTVKAVFIVLKDEFSGGGIGEAWQSLWNGITSFAYNSLIYVTGAVQGAVDVIAKSVTVAGQLIRGEFSEAGRTASKAFADGFAQNKKDIDGALENISNVARQLAIDKILKEAGKPPKEHQYDPLASTDQQIDKLNAEAAAQKALNADVDAGTLSVNKMIEAQQFYQQTAGGIAHLNELFKQHKITQTELETETAKLIQAQKNYNATKIDEKTIIDQFGLGEQITLLQKQISLIDATNLARAVGIAQLKAEQEADKAHMLPADRELYIAQQVTIAELTVKLAQDQRSYNDQLALQSKLMQEAHNMAQTYANGLADAFGQVGQAIGNMSTALTQYAAQQASFAEQQAKLDQAGNTDTAAQILLDQKKADASAEFYATEIGNVKNLFSAKSEIYKTLNAIEGVYNAIMLANSIARTVASLTETTTKVTGAVATSASIVAATGVETAATGVSVANAAAQSSAWGVTAVVKAIASLPFPLDLIAGAAVLAAIVGLGVSISGGLGGGGAAKQDTTAKDEQAAQGAGSVLGDATAKSDSIAKSLDQLTKNTNSDLDYSSQMVTSLRSIDTHIGSLTALLAQQLKVGGLFDTSGLGLGTSGGNSGILSVLLGGFFGSSSSTKTLIDQGITVAGETVGQAVAQGVQAAAYNTVQTTTKSSALFGLISSSRTSNSTISTALGSDFTNNIQDIISGLRSTVLDAATKLGVDGAQQVVDSLALNIGKISTKDMTGTDIQNALNAVFGELGDKMVEAILPQIKNLQQVGEGSLATLSRLVAEYQAVDDAAKIVGFTFSQVGVDSLTARDSLIQLAGGLDNFTKQASFFSNNFLTSAAQLSPIQKAVADEMARLGLAGITTKDQFAQVVQALDTSTTGGAALYSQLMNVAPAFAKVADAIQQLNDNRLNILIKYYQNIGDTLYATNLQREKELEATDASLRPFQALVYASEDLATAQQGLTNAQNDLTKAQQAANQVTQQSIDKFNGFITSLTSFQESLSSGPLAGNNLNRQYLVTRSLFQSTAAAAAGGDASAIGNLQSVSSDFLNASLARAGSVTDYVKDLAAVKDAVSSALAASHRQVDINTQQLYAIQDVNNSVLTVSQAVLNLTQAQLTYNKAQIELTAAQSNPVVNVTLNNVIPTPILNVLLPGVGNATVTTSAANDNSVTATATQQSNQTIATIASAAAAALGSITAAPAPVPDPAPVAATEAPAHSGGGYYDGAYHSYSTPGMAVPQSSVDIALRYPNAPGNTDFLHDIGYPGYAVGLPYVPYNGFRASLHEGEAVLNKMDATDYRANGGKEVVEAIKSLRADFKQMHKKQQDTNDLLRRFTSDGQTLNVKQVA